MSLSGTGFIRSLFTKKKEEGNPSIREKAEIKTEKKKVEDTRDISSIHVAGHVIGIQELAFTETDKIIIEQFERLIDIPFIEGNIVSMINFANSVMGYLDFMACSLKTNYCPKRLNVLFSYLGIVIDDLDVNMKSFHSKMRFISDTVTKANVVNNVSFLGGIFDKAFPGNLIATCRDFFANLKVTDLISQFGPLDNHALLIIKAPTSHCGGFNGGYWRQTNYLFPKDTLIITAITDAYRVQYDLYDNYNRSVDVVVLRLVTKEDDKVFNYTFISTPYSKYPLISRVHNTSNSENDTSHSVNKNLFEYDGTSMFFDYVTNYGMEEAKVRILGTNTDGGYYKVFINPKLKISKKQRSSSSSYE